MDSSTDENTGQQFFGRPTIEHSKRIQTAMAGSALAIVLALLTFEQTQAIRFAISCFAVSFPISIVFATKFEVDDPRGWFKHPKYPKFLYGFNLLIFSLGIFAVFASGSMLYLLMLVLGGVLASNLWGRKPDQGISNDSRPSLDDDTSPSKRAA